MRVEYGPPAARHVLPPTAKLTKKQHEYNALGGVRKDILIRPAGKVELHPLGQKAEAGRRQFRAALARQHRIEPVLERVQVQDVGCRIGHLRVAKFLGTPVRQLLLLGEIDAEQFGLG